MDGVQEAQVLAQKIAVVARTRIRVRMGNHTFSPPITKLVHITAEKIRFAMIKSVYVSADIIAK